MRLLGKFVSALGMLQRALVMPVPRGVVALFIVLSRGAVRTRSQFVLLGSLAMEFVHMVSLARTRPTLLLAEAPVDRQDLPSDEIRRAQKINNRIGDFLRCARALSRRFTN